MQLVQKGVNVMTSYMKQNKKHIQTLESAQYRLENIFKPLGFHCKALSRKETFFFSILGRKIFLNWTLL